MAMRLSAMDFPALVVLFLHSCCPIFSHRACIRLIVRDMQRHAHGASRGHIGKMMITESYQNHKRCTIDLNGMSVWHN